MFTTLIWKELLDHLLSLRFTITCVLCFFVMLVSFFVRSADYGQVREDFHKDAAADKVQLDEARGPWDVIWDPIHMRRVPNVLKVFVRGVSDYNGSAARMRENMPIQPLLPGWRSSITQLFPSIDLVAFVGLIMSLMAILFGYDVICGEKEQGTLRLMLSYSVPRDRILMVKWLGGFTALIIPYCFSAIAMVAIVMVQRSIALTDDDWVRLICIFALSVLYLAVIYSMALWISCVTSRSATSIMLLVTAWVVLFLGVPNLAPHIARWLQPTRNTQQMEHERYEASDEIWTRVVETPSKAYDKEHGFEGKWWKKINWGKWEERKKADVRRQIKFGTQCEAYTQQLRLYDKLADQANADLDTQIAASRALARLSPFGCFSMAAAELAGEGPGLQRDFLRQARDYHTTLLMYGCNEYQWNLRYRVENEGKRPPRWPASIQNPMPRFAYQAPLLGSQFRAVWLDVGILAGLVVLFFLLSFMSFLRYDVR